MNRRQRPPEAGVRTKSRWRRWLIPAALLALTPKCVLCVLGYFGLGAALGLGGPELCGATGGRLEHWEVWLPLAGIAGAAGLSTWLRFRAR